MRRKYKKQVIRKMRRRTFYLKIYIGKHEEKKKLQMIDEYMTFVYHKENAMH